jgi:pyridoxine 5-phosphate synthase
MRLYVNIDHVATVREARKTDEPDPVRAAVLAELGGADGITVHLREDRRHINDRDVRLLMETVRTPLNLELSVASDVVALAEELAPVQATLVPEKREEITTEGGLAMGDPGQRASVEKVARRLADRGVRTSLFIDPDPGALRAASEMGVDAVELHTGEYANAAPRDRPAHLSRIHEAARLGRELGLAVHAGHGLTYVNVVPVAALPEIEELNIGHSIVSRAVLVGMERAVREMAEIMRGARARIGEPGGWIHPLGY